MTAINESNVEFKFRPVTKLFEEQVVLHPDKLAVVTSKESFSYSKLNERANRIANFKSRRSIYGCGTGLSG